MSSKIIDLNLPLPHPAQAKVIQESKRFNVVCCGRRWGKTVLGINRLIHPALEGKPVAWFSPTYKSLADSWRDLRATLAPAIREKSEQEKRIELINGGVIDLWSLDSVDAGRGRKYALVVIDEAGMVTNLEDAWQQSIRPTLTDMIGSAWMLSTPRGFNYFKVLFDLGQDGTQEDWASWQMPTGANPHMDPNEIEAARRSTPEAAFNQEYLAQFVNGEGSVFRYVVEAATACPRTEPDPGHQYVIGCDWGRSNDYTVFLVLDITTRSVVALDRSNRVDYSVQRGRLRTLYERWRPITIIAEQNSVGQPIIEQLTRDGLRVEPFTTTNSTKANVIDGLALAFERGDIHILNDPVLVCELVAYRAEPSPSGLTRYGAPSGQHDDCVVALAIAWTTVAEQGRAVYPVPETELVAKDFKIPESWPRAYALEVTCNTVTVIWGARDPQSDIVYLYDEYSSMDKEIAADVVSIQRRGKWVPGVVAPEANGREQKDGDRLINLYQQEGLQLIKVLNCVESGITQLRQRMLTGRLKVFASLENFLQEFRRYRRDEQGQIVTVNDRFQNAARYLVSGIEYMRTKPPERSRYAYERVYPGERGWMH